MSKVYKMSQWDNHELHYHLREIQTLLRKYDLEAEMVIYDRIMDADSTGE